MTQAPTILTLLSLLHESEENHSATRRFRGEPVLAWTLKRLVASGEAGPVTIVCWDDQVAAIDAVVQESGQAKLLPPVLRGRAGEGAGASKTIDYTDATRVSRPPPQPSPGVPGEGANSAAATFAASASPQIHLHSLGVRRALPNVDAISAARRWSDGWRSGPLGASAFDAGFHAPAVREAAEAASAGAVLFIDPAAGLVDPELLSALCTRWREQPTLEFVFTQAASGLGAMLLARPLIDRLVEARAHPGRLLAYFPDQVSREPTSNENCVPAPTPAARSVERFALSSTRQIERLSRATLELNGQLIGSNAETLALRVAATASPDALPREIVLDLTTRRLSTPSYLPNTRTIPSSDPTFSVHRSPFSVPTDLDFKSATALIDELAALDDSRLTLAGVGDPLLYPHLLDLLAHAAERGVSVQVETDLLVEDAALISAFALSPADVISVHLPSISDATYEAVMGVAGYRRVLANLQELVSARQAAGRGTPLVIPLFAKCRQNLHEMEPWYDQWLRALGSAVIFGPTTFAGLIPDVAAADMAPPRRVPCRRLNRRLTVLSDGRFTTCEQDLLGRQAMGQIGDLSLADVWQKKFEAVRSCHADGRWNEMPACANCKEWHR